jgi:hypothetical protein
MSSKAARIRERALIPQNIDEDAIAALFVKAVNRLTEYAVIVH